MFDELFPSYCASTVMRWKPTWSKQSDPSGRYGTANGTMHPGTSLRANFFDRAITTHVAKYEK